MVINHVTLSQGRTALTLTRGEIIEAVARLAIGEVAGDDDAADLNTIFSHLDSVLSNAFKAEIEQIADDLSPDADVLLQLGVRA